MAAAQQQDDEEITGINVTPLVDIVLVLLIIFMVTANFIVRDTMEMDLPRAANGGETIEGLLNVMVDAQGRIFLDGAELTEDGLDRRAGDAVKTSPEARAMISADQALNYGRVMRVIDILKGRGITKIALVTEKQAAAAATP